MADKKISALTGATTPLAGTEVLPIVQSGATVKVAVSDLTAGRAISATSVTASTGNLIQGSSGKGVTTGGAYSLGFGTNGSTTQFTIDTSSSTTITAPANTNTFLTLAGSGAWNTVLALTSGGGGGENISAVSGLRVYTSSNGVFLSSGATAWSAYSDARLKNVTGTYENAIDIVNQLQPIKFTWKSDADNKPCVGVIAQSVLASVPEAVEEISMGDDRTGEKYLTVRYQDLIPVLIASIQQLSKEIETLKGNP